MNNLKIILEPCKFFHKFSIKSIRCTKNVRPMQTRNDNALSDTNSTDVRDIMPPYLHKHQVHNTWISLIFSYNNQQKLLHSSKYNPLRITKIKCKNAKSTVKPIYASVVISPRNNARNEIKFFFSKFVLTCWQR